MNPTSLRNKYHKSNKSKKLKSYKINPTSDKLRIITNQQINPRSLRN